VVTGLVVAGDGDVSGRRRARDQGTWIHGFGESINLGRNWSRALVGTVEVAQAGEHTITAQPELEGAREPRILIGK
jgi:hypothetical protein